MLARDRKSDQRSQSFSIRRFGQYRQCGKRLISLGAREPRSVLKAPGRFNCGHYVGQLLTTAIANDLANFGRPLRFALAQGVDQWQRRLALREVIAQVLTASLRIGLVVEHIIDELVGGAQVTTE